MAQHIKGKFGFTTVVIDQTYYLFTCKIITSADTALPIIQGVSARNITDKKGNVRSLITYCTMDYTEHRRMQIAIAKHLEDHAMYKLKRKYAWAHEDDELPRIVGKIELPELSLEDRDIPSWGDDLPY